MRVLARVKANDNIELVIRKNEWEQYECTAYQNGTVTEWCFEEDDLESCKATMNAEIDRGIQL